MTLPSSRSKFSNDFLIPSFYGNFETVSSNSHCRKLHRVSTKENRECSVSRLERPSSRTSRHSHSHRNKEKSSYRAPFKEKNTGDCVNSFPSKPKLHSRTSKTSTQFGDEDDIMETARNTSDYNLESLRRKAVSLNFEFNQLHDSGGDYLIGQMSSQKSDDDDEDSDSSNNALKRKYTEVFHPKPSTLLIYTKKQVDNCSKTSERTDKATENSNDLKIILKTLKQVFKSAPIQVAPVQPLKEKEETTESSNIYDIVKALQEEQERFRVLINTQQNQLNYFQSKYLKAEKIIKSQKHEIENLSHANEQLENEFASNIETLQAQLEAKTAESNNLTQAIKNEKIRSEKLSKQNCELIARLQEVKNELSSARAKLADAAQKRATTMHKLKANEKDLKIFKNQNSVLKSEKRTLFDEFKRLKDLNDELTKTCTRNISRQKERGESQQRILQRKILDLELELSRSRNSTSDLIEERDKLIAELQQQLNTLVHNFEVSQKHIRVLRRHIHSISGNSKIPQKVMQ